MKKLGKRAGALSPPKDWDFRDVGHEELEACLCYEFARESESIVRLAEAYLAHVRAGRESETVTAHCDLLQRQTQCAFLLEYLAPHFDLRNKTWKEIRKETRAEAANLYRSRSAFEAAIPDVSAYRLALEGRLAGARGVKEWDGTNLLFASQAEIALVHIDWTQPISKIKSACGEWLENKIRQRGGTKKTGRHARQESHARDLLRGLGAMRLLAKHTLKEAISITRSTLGEPLYSGNKHRDDSRLTGRTAWNNGIKNARSYFKETFRFEKTEPISWRR